jgi:DNA-binding NtrC family response regulator
MFNHEGAADVAARPRHWRLLAIDDDPIQQQLLVAIFRKTPTIEVVTAADGESALGSVSHSPPDIVLLDLCMPGISGLEILQKLKAAVPRVPVVVITATADVRTAVEAIQLGAYQFLIKPVNHQELVVIVKRALERTELLTELESLRHRADGEDPLTGRFGTSPPMQLVSRQIRQVAGSHFTVLVQGQTGVGKEVVARSIHDLSPRAAGPFVAIDCGAIPENLLESELFGYEKGAFSGADRRKDGLLQVAQAGTLLLDEVGNLPPGTQAKLLRVLQERQVLPLGSTAPRKLDARFIFATNVSLEEAAKEGRFRSDLFYRLAEFTITVPPLRERGRDILLLARRFLDEANAELRRAVAGFDEAAAQELMAHPWPGNVRELRNVVRQAVLLAEDFTITGSDLRVHMLRGRDEHRSAPAGSPSSLREIADAAIETAEREAIMRALQSTKGNKSQAARLLHVDFKTLHLKMRRYGITISHHAES